MCLEELTLEEACVKSASSSFKEPTNARQNPSSVRSQWKEQMIKFLLQHQTAKNLNFIHALQDILKSWMMRICLQGTLVQEIFEQSWKIKSIQRTITYSISHMGRRSFKHLTNTSIGGFIICRNSAENFQRIVYQSLCQVQIICDVVSQMVT